MQDYHNQLIDYLHVQKLGVIGRYRHDLLLNHFGSLSEALRAPFKELLSIPGISHKIASQLKKPIDHDLIEKEISHLKNNNVHINLIIDTHYPAGLKKIDDAPIVIFYQGTLIEQDQIAFAIVGSRTCSSYGYTQAFCLARELAQKGFTIISGLARGIDSAAHRGALDVSGRTIAIQARGLKSIYPRSAQSLAQDIKQHGAILTEFSWATEPKKFHFPKRNRIISGLSLGTIVIEASQQSGSLITARWALEQNRDVFALPGRIDENHSLGCHHLIQQGAKLITCVDDILEEFPSLKNNVHQHKKTVKLSLKQKQVLELIQNNITDYNSLTRHSSLSPGDLSLCLFELENQKIIKELAGRRWQLIDRALVTMSQ